MLKDIEKTKKISITINGKVVKCDKGASILQACQQEEIPIPVLCYHEKLKVAGNCRMCLVEVAGCHKLVASCATPATDKMEIFTESPVVKDSQKGNLEFLLINHPLDCPVCDRGGDCDLQDASMDFGLDRGSFWEPKHAVLHKDFGPLIGTAMERCIHCNRCVRFAQDIAGVSEIGVFGRGETLEINTVLGQVVTSELSGNMIDLCPVGALNSKPYGSRARPWELTHYPSIDVTDAVGSHVNLHVKNDEVMRVVPRLKEEINEEWISDKARFSYDGFNIQRLDTPYIRKEGVLYPVSWIDALKTVVKKLTSIAPHEIGVIAGNLMDVETLFLMRQLLDSMGVIHRDCRQEMGFLPMTERGDYLFNTTIQGIEDSDACLLVGTNPRLEASLINVRLKKRSMQGDFSVGLVGPHVDLTYAYEHLSDTAAVLNDILANKHPFSKVLKKAKRPMLILGQGALTSLEGEAIYKTCRAIAQEFGLIQEDWNGFNVLHTAAGRVGGLEVGFVPKDDGYDVANMLKAARAGRLQVIYLLGADEVPLQTLGDAFVIYQGHHGDAGANRADVIFPGAASIEKDALYVNTEGRAQEALRVREPLGEAREDWKIIRGLSEVIGRKLPYNTREEILKDLQKMYPVFSKIGDVFPGECTAMHEPKKISSGFLKPFITNFYMTDVIGRCSPVMASCKQ
ncbi:MAG: NADH-quinone oxidoreductase subunit NuoG [Alphaproteobacteria bacterium]